MNLKPGGKGKFRDGLMPDGSVQSMHLPNGQLKGIKLILEEHGLWPQSQLRRICDDCKKHSPVSESCCAVRVLSLQPDFLAQRPLIENKGYKKCFGMPLNERTVPEALNSVSLEQIRRYSCHSWRFMDAYRKGLTGTAALYAVKQYKSHQRIPENVI
ncbi:hypothetical protein RhiirA4_431900 [Rhizophagus irregularis]|uniref:Uncharacterized protein n=1 Tax=Rhizophagus irregularis TaxID=588596 RepID=A0A2I1HRN9_9GLOM|nr:hypothetical protein RhiirA4_431900 [Rhizophagus irregularis]